MLYYQHVHLILSPSVFQTLIQWFDEDVLVELLKSKRLILHAHEMQVGCGVIDGGRAYFTSIMQHKDVDDVHSCLYTYHRKLVTRNSTKNLGFADKFSPLMDYYTVEQDLTDSIQQSFLNDGLLKQYATDYIHFTCPLYHELDKIDIHAELKQNTVTPQAFGISSNINIPDFDYSLMIKDIAEATVESFIAAEFESEINTSALNASLMQSQIGDTIKRSSNSVEQINAFQDNVMYDTINLGEAYVNGIISSKELLTILEESHKFRGWLTQLPEDKLLIGSYLEEVTKSTLADKAWIKVLRLSTTIGFGLIPTLGMVTGPLSSIIDATIVDKLLKGWKPNMFVDGVLKTKLMKD